MAVNINRIALAHTAKTHWYLGEMMKFEELSEKSQEKASEALLYALQAEMDSNRSYLIISGRKRLHRLSETVSLRWKQRQQTAASKSRTILSLKGK
ncbi:hypothetical protein [Arsenophonus endosymbiont of Aleurodicus floccissimus]|uniref:hypothetical protein n=1 Tax=Arsenophonus endosymbiont of Aleurodicus floccissimus TaxID=2152761 RepID=UPI000E6B4207|nr:hypothetical protein [Arsenophonus endosymbiont of Aleurodicus floccissimus]